MRENRRTSLSVLAAALIISALAAIISAPDGRGSASILIVGLNSVPSNLNQTMESIGGAVLRTDTILNFTVVGTFDVAGFTSRATNLSVVKYVEPDLTDVTAFFTPNDPLYPNQWDFPQTHLPDAWDLVPQANQTNVTVAVVDTGVDWNHPDLNASMWNGNSQHGFDLTVWYPVVNCVLAVPLPLLNIKSCLLEQPPFLTQIGPMDYDGHGTHVAGTIGAVINNSIGIAGGSQARIMAVKVLPTAQNLFNSVDIIASGIALAAVAGADVISMSLGLQGDPDNLKTLNAWIKLAHQLGAVLVAASGNYGSTVPVYPAAWDEVIAVGATNRTNARAEFSSYGPWLNLSAPGDDGILSTRSEWITISFQGFEHVGHGYWEKNGTSMATPHVSAVAALAIAKNPSLSNDVIKKILECTADDLGVPGRDDVFGWGLVNATKAVQQAALGKAC